MSIHQPAHCAITFLLLLSGCSADAPAPVAPAPPPSPPIAASAPIAVPGPPVAPVRPVSETYFGITVTDPYRWMEQDSPERAAWLKGQSDFARATLVAIPQRAALLARVHELGEGGEEVSAVRPAGGRLFYLKRSHGQEQARLYVRDLAAGAPEHALVDPAVEGHFSVDDHWPSLDGKLLAYKISPAGSEKGVLRVIDVATGKALPDVIDRLGFSDVVWLDGKSFLYPRLRKLPADAPQSEHMKKMVTFAHTLGRDPESDPAVFGAGVSAATPMSDGAFPLVLAPSDGTDLVGIVAGAFGGNLSVYTAPRAKLAGPGTPWKKVVDPRDEVRWVDAHGGELYMLTHRDAPRLKVAKVSLAHPDMAHATVVVPEGDRAIDAIAAASDALYVGALESGLGRLYRVPYTARGVEPVALPFEGTLSGIATDGRTPGVVLQLASWAVAPRHLVFDPATKKLADAGLAAPSPVDYSGVVAEETQARSADGTMVPLSIVHMRGAALDGSHPTWLRVYGSYGRSELPEFQAERLAWLERGGVYAVCHARGGGERGEGWHEAGMMLNKQHTIDDFFGCADALVERKYTSPARLAGEGTSAGGVPISMAINQHPERFAAALVLVGLTNTLRLEQSENVSNVSEFGTVKTEEGFRALLGADGLTGVKDGARYPAVLLTTGMNDGRAAPWMQMKLAARLQAATSSGKPVLLRVEYEGGHMMGATRQEEDEKLADTYAFLFAHLSG